MGARVIIKWEGLDAAIARLSSIEEKAPRNLETQIKQLAQDTEQEWKRVTPRKSGRLQEGDKVEPDGMTFTLKNSVRYYGWVDTGHMTARGWRTKRGYRLAKRRSRVQGREMTSKTVQFVLQNIHRYLSKFLDDV